MVFTAEFDSRPSVALVSTDDHVRLGDRSILERRIVAESCGGDRRHPNRVSDVDILDLVMTRLLILHVLDDAEAGCASLLPLSLACNA
jgi:hypothetical protein